MKKRIMLSAMVMTLLGTMMWLQQSVVAKAVPNASNGLVKSSELLKLLRIHRAAANGTRSTAQPASHSAPFAKAPHTFKFATADFPGAAGTQATGSGAGTVVGIFSYDPNTQTTGTSFTFHGGQYKTFSVPGATGTFSFSINSLGQIVGGYLDTSSVFHGFVNDGGAFATVDYPGATSTIVTDINAAGQMVGIWTDAAGTHGFLDDFGVFTSLDFPGGTNSQAAAINSAGEIVGIFDDATHVTHGFILNGSVYTQFDAPLATLTIAFGLNDSGTITGSFDDASGTHGFVYSGGTFNRVDVPGAADTSLTHVPNKGPIAGYFTDQLSEIHGLTAH